MNLPSVFQNKDIGNINNDQEYFYSLGNKTNTRAKTKSNINIDDKINNLFKSNKFIYKLNVLISLKDKELDTTIVGKVNNSLITINNELIPISEIIDINEK